MKIECKFRTATIKDIQELKKLFCNTVMTVNRRDYTAEEVAHPINSGERKKILSLHHGKFNVRVFGKLHAAIQYIISFYNSKSRK